MECKDTRLAATDAERQAAMDAAIEYEDAWPADRAAGKECTMAGQEQARDVAAELVAATQAFLAARDRMIDLCREVGRAGEAPAAEAERPRRGGRRKAADAGPEGGGKTRWLPKVRVKCRMCGAVVEGGRERGGRLYPYRHENPYKHKTCAGSQVVGERVADGAGATE